MALDSDRTDVEDQPTAEVDRIRDIIFGPQMRLYEQHFRRVTGQLDLLGKQLEDLQAALDQQGSALSTRIGQLDLNLEQKTAQLGVDSRQSLDALRADLSTRLEQQDAELKAQGRQWTAELRKQGQELRAEFTAAQDALDDEKASRHNLGDLLIEMGTRLKQQAGVADLLGQLGTMPEKNSRT